jgi:hypothetical protein
LSFGSCRLGIDIVRRSALSCYCAVSAVSGITRDVSRFSS